MKNFKHGDQFGQVGNDQQANENVQHLDGTVTKQQLLDRISFDIDSGNTGVYKIKKGRPVIPQGFEKFTANTMAGVLGFTFLGVCAIVSVNEALGLVKIADKTPLTHIRDFINKPK